MLDCGLPLIPKLDKKMHVILNDDKLISILMSLCYRESYCHYASIAAELIEQSNKAGVYSGITDCNIALM